jgi:DNA-binding NtrC family response regulator
MPPLRERTEDLGTITIDIQKGIQKERKIPIKELTPDAWEAIYGYDWRGNIRELKNVLMTGTIKAGKSSRITSKNLFNKPILESMAKKYGIFEVLGFTKEAYPTMSTVMDKVKYLYIRRLMIEANGNVSEACRLGSMTRTSLYQYARRLKIDLKDF